MAFITRVIPGHLLCHGGEGRGNFPSQPPFGSSRTFLVFIGKKITTPIMAYYRIAPFVSHPSPRREDVACRVRSSHFYSNIFLSLTVFQNIFCLFIFLSCPANSEILKLLWQNITSLLSSAVFLFSVRFLYVQGRVANVFQNWTRTTG